MIVANFILNLVTLAFVIWIYIKQVQFISRATNHILNESARFKRSFIITALVAVGLSFLTKRNPPDETP